MGRPLPMSTRIKNSSWIVYCGSVLSMALLLLPIEASAHVLNVSRGIALYPDVSDAVLDDKQVVRLEPGKTTGRELKGGQAHAYLVTLAAGQYAKLVIDQHGIDVAVKLFGPDGKQIAEFDSEIRLQGQEPVSWVAPEAGSYRIDVLTKQKNAPPGRYEIKVIELRAATENDRALDEARKLDTEVRKLFAVGKYDEALPLAERELKIREKVSGPEHATVAGTLNNLGLIYYSRNDFVQAEPLLQRSLAIREKALGSEHPSVAISLNSLASLYYEKGDFVRAEPLFQQALTIREKSLGPDHILVAASLNNLAGLYDRKGDDANAEPLFVRAQNIYEKVLGPEHYNVAYTLNNLGLNYSRRGLYAKAEPLYRRAQAIAEKVVGPKHPLVVGTLSNLALLYSERSDYAKAEPLFQLALVRGEEVLGPENYNVALTVNFLADLYCKKGEFAKAEPLYRRALATWEKSLGPEHPYVAASLNGLAVVHAAKGDVAQALTFLSRANAVAERNLARNLTNGSERQKLAYLSLFSDQKDLRFSLDFMLSLHSQGAPSDPRALELALTTLLIRKGRALDATADTNAVLRSHATPEIQQLFNQLAEARSQLAALTLKESGSSRADANQTRLKLLEEDVDRFEAALNARSTEYRAQSQPVTLAAVQAALPAGSALVEFSIYTPLELQTGRSKPPRYIAYLLPAQGKPKWVDLGETSPLDQAVEMWRQSLRDPSRSDAKQLARAVDEKLMRPVRGLLSETRRLLIAPDGLLNFIPFAALVDEQDEYLVEHYAISYLTSGRELLRLQTSEPSKSPPLVVANPTFGRIATVAGRAEQRSRNSRARNTSRATIDQSQVFFQPLPGTGDEAQAIKAVLPGASLLMREQATEAALKQVRAPLILHIATHGFFLSDQEEVLADVRGRSRGLWSVNLKPESEEPLRDFALNPPVEMLDKLAAQRQTTSILRLSKWAAHIENPLLRSGLALAGANQGKSGDDDGVLTALEATGLDLWGTKLVVLSACDTGVGEVKNGEGVQGLRRALVLAGSESQIMSLWPVPDEATKDLMVPYYEALQQKQGRSEGLRQVQLRMLQSKDRRHPFYWAAFIQSGEWANLEGQR